jgi:glycosyltransferase involved in cell wall biosynthesis
MLAEGLAARGIGVTVFAPPSTWAAVTADVAGTGVASAGVASTAGEPGGAPVVGGVKAAGAVGGVPFEGLEIADRPRPAKDLAAIRQLRARLRLSRPGVVHAHGLRAGAVAALAIGRKQRLSRPGVGHAHGLRAGVVAALAVGRRRERPCLVVTVHNASPMGGLAGVVYGWLERLVARRADEVLCVSGDLESRMRARGAANVGRAVVPAPEGAPPASASVLAGLRAELGAGRAPVVLAATRLAPQKGLGTLVEAAARWRDRDPVPLVVIAGTGPLLPELTAAAQAGQARVRFLGHRDDVPNLLAVADVVVLPSVWEGQALIVHETLRAGRPLVATRTGGTPDVTGPDAALLVPPGDAGALSEAVLSVLDDPELAARLGEAAIKQAESLPSEQDALDAVLAVYRRLAAA